MQQYLRSLLLARPEVAALVGPRVDWGARPQGDVAPSICMTVISDAAHDHSLDGPGLSRARVQVDCFAASYAASVTAGNAVRFFLDGYRDAALAGVFLAGGRDLQDGEGDLRMHCRSLDFFVTYHFSA